LLVKRLDGEVKS